MTRLFIALELSDDAKNELLRIQKKLSTGLAKITWVYKKNMHLTLKFIGEVEEDKIQLIVGKLEKIKFKKINLCIGKMGFFPEIGIPNVIWVSVNPEKEVIALQRVIDEELLDLFSSEQKFQAHLTIGRVKTVKKKDEFMKIAKAVEVKQVCFEVSGFTLYKSTLERSGRVYGIIKKF